MPVFVNGELVPNEAILEEAHRLRERPEWRDLPEGLETSMRVRQEAELRLIDRVLLRQQADKDTTPLDPGVLESEVRRLTEPGCRGAAAGNAFRQNVESDLRCRRTVERLMGPIPKVTKRDICRFYKAERRNFRRPEMVHAAHIVKHVSGQANEEQAQAGIQAALAELERGEAFAAVAARHSDCKEGGGDLGFFPRGQMVTEFDNVVFAMKPGQRSGIFRTSFGFHIAEVRAMAPESAAPLGEVRQIIAEFLVAMKERDAFRRVIRDLRAKAHIRRVSTYFASAGSS